MSTPRFEQLIREAREDLGKKPAPRVDWNEVDRRLFGHIEQSEKGEAPARGPLGVFWTTGAALVSAAAVAALVAGRTSDNRPFESARAGTGEPAGTVVAIEGDGDLFINGKPAAVGAVLQRDDVVDARAARATVERAGSVTFSIERGTRTVVKRVQGALVLALDRGTIEAQVVPVAQGEAFAVDVGHARLAVHGTHLRVERQHAGGAARAGDLVVVDLSEGVISVGETPRMGSTSGTLITAPAHAEFAIDDAQGTLAVTHGLEQVRAPVALGPMAQGRSAPPPAAAPAPRSDPGTEGRAVSVVVAPARSEPRPGSAGVAPQGPTADPNAEGTLAAAVHACFAERPSAANVTVSVSTMLHLVLGSDGSVRSARFDPPVAVDVNKCAASSIYRTRFTHGGVADISVDFREPSTTAP